MSGCQRRVLCVEGLGLTSVGVPEAQSLTELGSTASPAVLGTASPLLRVRLCVLLAETLDAVWGPRLSSTSKACLKHALSILKQVLRCLKHIKGYVTSIHADGLSVENGQVQVSATCVSCQFFWAMTSCGVSPKPKRTSPNPRPLPQAPNLNGSREP